MTKIQNYKPTLLGHSGLERVIYLKFVNWNLKIMLFSGHWSPEGLSDLWRSRIRPPLLREEI